jgi:Domain of unknown function (DUF4145)
MNERSVIDGRLLEWTQALRVLRNEGAHYTGTQVKRADAEDALAFAEAVLDYVYVPDCTVREVQGAAAVAALTGQLLLKPVPGVRGQLSLDGYCGASTTAIRIGPCARFLANVISGRWLW